ncbi:MAG TPA: hypothetical protein DCG28_05080 [Lachnospiraceae bacterium]|nr:hypothetical protein [Lachnospiraceae bacterium]
MKKRAMLLTALLTLAMSVSALADTVRVSVNGEIIDFADQGAEIVEGRTLIPVRGVFDKLDYEIGWDAETKTVKLVKGDSLISIKIGENSLTASGKEIYVDVPAQIINGRTMLPLRAIGEAAGADVFWDGESKLASVVTDYTSDVVKNNVNVTEGSQEDKFVSEYTAIVEEFNKKGMQLEERFMMTAEGEPGAQSVAELSAAAKELSSLAESTKQRLSEINVPSRFGSFMQVSNNYLTTLKEFSDFVGGLTIDNIAASSSKYNELSAKLLTAISEYRTASEAL